MRSLPSLILWLAVSFAAAFVGTRFLPGEWYQHLAKPSWTPPDAVFGPVWTVLYIMMAVSAWLVWRERAVKPVGAAITVFLLQLALNAAWSWLFFGERRIGYALTDIELLCVTILVTITLFWRIRPLAGALLVPYLLWVCFATALNFAIWQLNRA